MNENTQVPICTLKGKLKKVYNKLIQVEFTCYGLIDADDPEGNNLWNNVSTALYRICKRSDKYLEQELSYIKNARTRASVIKMVRELSEEEQMLLKQELVNYIKPNLPSYDSANTYIRNNIIDLDIYRVQYYYKGKLYKSYSDRNTMYQNCCNSFHSDREDAKRVFNAALEKLCEGLSGKPLYDMLCKIFCTDVEIKEVKYLGSRNSEVHSSSFTTYYDYEYEAVFKFQTVTFNYTHSSYYSGGW